MIKVTLTNIIFNKGVSFNKTGNSTIALKVEGHSGSSKKGEDIICSAVSALAQTAVLAVTVIGGIKPESQVSDGFISMKTDVSELDDTTRDRLQTILGTFIIGITEITKTYPQQVTIDFKDEDL